MGRYLMAVQTFFLLSIVAFGTGNELPGYFSKCSISDPNLNQCIKEKANEVIPIIAKGDAKFGIPPVSPMSFTAAPLDGDPFIMLYDTYTDDLKKMVMLDIGVDFKRKRSHFTAWFDRIEVLAQNYSVISGKIIDLVTAGHGKFNFTVVNVTVDFKTGLSYYKKNGEEYVELVNPTIHSNVTRACYNFGNMTSPQTDDVNAYIHKNWRKFWEQFRPKFHTYMLAAFEYPINSIISKVPLGKLFSP